MVFIPEYKRDSSKDYLFILRSLNQIPFPVGKTLLSSFLIGDIDHPSIQKNKLFELSNFGILKDSRENIDQLIQSLIINKFIDESGAIFNRSRKVLSISIKGQQELISPSLKDNKNKDIKTPETQITKKELEAFKELSDFLKGLNNEQKKAVISTHNKILCVAGAGTGKTTTLVKRIEFLAKLNRVAKNKILAITFTRKAREEMKKRLDDIGVGAVVETFNSFCEKILIKNSKRIYSKKVKVASYQDKMMGVLRALDNMQIPLDLAIEKYFSKQQRRLKSNYQLQAMFVNDCFSVLDYYKSTKKDIKDQMSSLGPKDHENALMIYQIAKFLDSYMKISGLRTYSDQIEDVLSFFQEHPSQIPLFDHILVDEYQDVNAKQVQLLNTLSPKNIFYVGDPRQSIFGWRGSDINHILNLLNKKDVELINLTKNYRSKKEIVDFMNKLISKMKMPDIEPANTNNVGGVISLCNFQSEEAEIDFITKKVLRSKFKRNEIFILARTNRYLINISKKLKEMKIKHIIKTEDSKDIQAKEDEITLSTIHSIKGLEAEEVYIAGCTVSNFPPRASEHPVVELVKMYKYDKLEEERRLFYVAVSRAKTTLNITYHGKAHTYFITDKSKDFIKEISF